MRTALAIVAAVQLTACQLAAAVPAWAGEAAPLDVNDPRMKAGAAIYGDTCKACHGGLGLGVHHLIPKLAGSDVLRGDPTGSIVLVLQGGKAATTATDPTGAAMPSLGWRLNDRQVADVLTYVRNSWGNAQSPVAASAVKALRP